MFKRSSIAALVVLCGMMMMLSTSCKTPREKRLEAENERLNNEIIKSDSVQIQFMNAYAEIDANLQAIKTREKMINRNSQEAEENADVQQRIIADIVEIGKLMEKNRQKLQSMESMRRQLNTIRTENKKLKDENTAIKNAATPKTSGKDAERMQALEQENARLAELNKGLENSITRLKKQLAESEARIESLQQELASLKDAYAELKKINEDLEASKQQYLASLDEKDATISSLNEQLSQSKSVYFIAASAKELKSKGVVLGKIVNPNVKLSTLTQVDNIDDFRVIETKSSKAELVSNHPNGSYTFDTKDKKNIKINITNPKNFWSVSRVCVVSTK